MPESNFMPPAVEGADGSPQVSPAYVYAIIAEDLSEGVFLTSWESEISVSGMPARYGASDPQAFVPTQISHGEITKRAEFDKHAFTVMARFDAQKLNASFIYAAAVPLRVDVIRIARGTLDGEANVAAWGADTYVVQSGIVEAFSLRGETVSIVVVPRVFHMESKVPRLWFNRTCQWALYGEGCGLDSTLFEWESQILSVDLRLRTIVVNGAPADTEDNHFEAGYFVHNDSGQIFTCLTASVNIDGDTVIVLGHFDTVLEVGDQLVLHPGCNHTVSDCGTRFDNLVNYGGFSQIPERNPSIHGV